MSAAESLPFDQVVVTEGGERRVLSPPEFFALPLAQRIGHVIAERAVFYAGAAQVDARTVLVQMRHLRTRG
jgi:hypothetical protein